MPASPCPTTPGSSAAFWPVRSRWSRCGWSARWPATVCRRGCRAGWRRSGRATSPPRSANIKRFPMGPKRQVQRSWTRFRPASKPSSLSTRCRQKRSRPDSGNILMTRVLVFLLFVLALGLGFSWLADRPGDLVATFNGYQYEVSLMVAAVTVTAVVAAVMIVWWLGKALWNSHYTISRYVRVRRRDRGYQALSTGMIAAGAGDAAKARTMNS